MVWNRKSREIQPNYVQPSCATSFLLYCQDWNFFSDRVIAVPRYLDMHEAYNKMQIFFSTSWQVEEIQVR